jgi:uncharacterized membrane protein
MGDKNVNDVYSMNKPWEIVRAFGTLLFLDSIYIILVKEKFEDLIFHVQHVILHVKLLGVVLCYILLFFALYWFILRENKSPEEAFLLGLAIYGVYDSTNYATLKSWDPKFAIMDTIWGGVLFSLTVVFSRY